MPRALRIRLTEEEKQQLYFLSNQVKTTKRTKTRIEVLKLSDRGWKVEQIALELNCAPATVRRTIARWFSQEKEGLFDAPRSGRTRRSQKEIKQTKNRGRRLSIIGIFEKISVLNMD
ncbi:MAG: helix-turn-helix domain-containing protein [Hydrococcus sp. CRU_1_1]|nr:helix-turn-helix domain-containing protein [Hydrococcus sp. CRU_1_1]